MKAVVDVQLREKDAEMEASGARLQQLESLMNQHDSAICRQIVDKLTSSLRLSINASQADVIAELTADLVKTNRQNDILDNCLKASQTCLPYFIIAKYCDEYTTFCLSVCLSVC